MTFHQIKSKLKNAHKKTKNNNNEPEHVDVGPVVAWVRRGRICMASSNQEGMRGLSVFSVE